MAQGHVVPDFSQLDRETEIRLVFALWNLVRLLCEDTEQHKDELTNIFEAMIPANSAVLFAAVRNSISREAENRPSQNGNRYDGMDLVRKHNLVQYSSFMNIIYKITREQLH